ncbi:MAG: ATP-dependent helicase Lhr and Lhr-like helicase, partial [Acidimicrobiaceae bacterium]|nr:ATP-dependent helicase Lhr and Lhr-like helicase [Acidimicrobiaceae bacterium]
YVANFLYEGDAPLAERRAQALTLDRRMLAELVGADELRELIDPGALAELELELQALTDRRRAGSVDAAHDLLRRLGDLTVDELRARSADDYAPLLVAERRAVSVRIAGEERLIAAEDAGRYRDALGVVAPAGVPEAFLAPVEDARLQLVRRWARNHGPFVTSDPGERFGLPAEQVEQELRRLLDDGRIERGAFRPDGVDREWCDVDVLRLLRQRSLAALRREVEPTSAEALARFLPAWHGVPGDSGGLDRLFEVVGQLQGVPVPASVLERDVLTARVRDYSPRLLDELMASGEVMWVGAGPLGRDDGKVALYRREQAPLLIPPLASATERPSGEEHERLREILASRGACFFRELSADDKVTLEALWDLVWAGEVTNDSFAPVRAAGASRGRSGRHSASASRARSGRPRLGSLTALGPPRAQGRWSLVDRDWGDATTTQAAHALAGTLLERHGVLTREAVRGEGIAGGFAGVYPVLRAMEEAGRIRRGYFVAGLGGAQFALPGAVDRLRSARDGVPDGREATLVLAATDPANVYGLSMPWSQEMAGRPARVAGAYVVLVGGVASLYVERNGKGLVALRPFDGSWEEQAVAAVGGLLATGRFSRLAVERFPEELRPFLEAADFVPSPKGMVRYA